MLLGDSRPLVPDRHHGLVPLPLEPAAEPTLTLITCFPFDAALPGGPLRYVVQAVAD
jgi:hypothetical protein